MAFFYVLLCVNSRSRDLGTPKLAHITHSLIFMLSPNFNFLGFTVAGYEQITPHLPNSQTKTKELRAYAKTQLAVSY